MRKILFTWTLNLKIYVCRKIPNFGPGIICQTEHCKLLLLRLLSEIFIAPLSSNISCSGYMAPENINKDIMIEIITGSKNNPLLYKLGQCQDFGILQDTQPERPRCSLRKEDKLIP
jgi:hypothetical protein